ncbi:MAG: hypothetical protein NT033_07325, partial [Candidatus Omnitrophica bacterium]|nr:hypothetical protein [Candidatus Omnitrophota bacterium]
YRKHYAHNKDWFFKHEAGLAMADYHEDRTITRLKDRLFRITPGYVQQIPVHIELAQAYMDADDPQQGKWFLNLALKNLQNAKELIEKHLKGQFAKEAANYMKNLQEGVQRLLQFYPERSAAYYEIVTDFSVLLEMDLSVTPLPEGMIYPIGFTPYAMRKIELFREDAAKLQRLRREGNFNEVEFEITRALETVGNLSAQIPFAVNDAALYVLALVVHNERVLLYIEQMRAGIDVLTAAQEELALVRRLRDTVEANRNLLNGTQQQLFVHEKERLERQIAVGMARAEERILPQREELAEQRRMIYTFDKAAFEQKLAEASVAEQAGKWTEAEGLLNNALQMTI